MRRALAWTGLVLLLVVAFAAGAAAWLLGTEPGTRWLLSRVPGLVVDAPQGRITGGAFQAARLRWQGGGTRVDIERLAWRDLRWRWRPHAGAWLGIEWLQPGAQRVQVRTTPGGATTGPPAPPRDLRLPVDLAVDRLVIAVLQINDAPPIEAIEARLHLGDERGSVHRVEMLTLQTSGITLRGFGRIAAGGDLAVRAELEAGASAPLPWTLRTHVTGPLARLMLEAGLAAQGAQAQLRATVTPFAAWPLAALQGSTQDLDLAALAPALPSTRLTGRVVVDSRGMDQPVEATVAMVNASPGPWDSGRLPLRTLDARVQGSLLDRRVITLPSFVAGLDGGRIEGSGRWSPEALSLDLALHTLRPQRLHTRAPALVVSGPLALQLQGLATGGPLAGQLQARLEGQGVARQRVQVQADAGFEFGPERWRIDATRVRLAAGDATAELAGSASRDVQRQWQVAAQGRLQRFDPSRWWAGLPRGPWQLNGDAQVDLRGPEALDWKAVRGTATLSLAPSRLAGVALQGQAELQAAATSTLKASMQAGANRARIDLRATPQALERGQLEIDAPALAALAPLVPLAGRLQASADLEGPWSTLRTEARVAAQDLRASGFALASLDAAVHGSLPQHRVLLRAATPLSPPAWVQAQPGGTVLHADVDGRWAAAAAGGGRWSGIFSDLRIAPRSGGQAAWIAADRLAAEVDLGPAYRVHRATLAPGQASLLGATLRWQQAAWGDVAGLTLDARLDPLAVAPWLQRFVPQAGWSGDLRVAARAQVSSGRAFDADVVVERVDGDLALQREGRAQPLGLSALRLALAARGGTWTTTQAVTGAQIGVLAGSQTVRAAPADRWPAPASPLEGAVTLQTPDLDVWSAWLPIGWQAGGELRAVALLAGTAGAPDWRGRIEGSKLALGNLFEGVDLTDGQLAVALDGDSARIERFTFRGGDGTLAITGGARLGAAPEARLEAVATRFQALGRADRRIVTSGRATVTLSAVSVVAEGRFTVDEGLIDVTQGGTAKLDADVVVVNRPGAPPPDPTPPRALPKAQLDLRIDLGDALVLQGRGLKTRLAGNLRVTTPEGRLAVDGLVRTEGGTYAAYGQNLAIERGVIRFAGELKAPTLDILAVRPDLDTRVGVLIIGTAVNPRVRLYSEPDMSDLDKLSWLVLGRASGGLGTADTALLQRAALALLAGEKGGGAGGVVQRLGLDELSVGQTGTGDARDTVVTLGKQINQRLFIAYERGLNAAAGSWQLIYRVAQRFTLRASSGDESALDAIFTWRW